MAEERRSSLSWDMGGSFQTDDQTNSEINQRELALELADVRVQLDKLKNEHNAAMKLLKKRDEDIQDFSRELLEIMRQNREHEALSRILLFILSATSAVDLTTLILKYAQYVNADPDLACVALKRLYGDVVAKAIPHIIEIVKGNVDTNVTDNDLYSGIANPDDTETA